ncbi:hypothetical protein BKA81DRAFT_402269 [Phyllosticta paracitricarpa]|uniref:Uncharacterized protein n=1 Tax=Phyllosticta paracitricarpa TaxID=2016321 RepID=A0ABR1MUK5_9PEZI
MTRPSSRATLSFILSRPASSAAEQIASFVAEQTCAAGKAFAADKMCAADETCTADKTSAAEQTVVCASPTVARGLPRMSWTLPARAFCLTQTPSSQRGLARSASRASSTHQGPPRRQFRLSLSWPSPSPPAHRTSPHPVEPTSSPSEERQHNLGRVLSPIIKQISLFGCTGSNDDPVREASVELLRSVSSWEMLLLGADDYTFDVGLDDCLLQIEQEHTAADEHTAPKESRVPPMNETDKAVKQLRVVGQSAIHHAMYWVPLS